MDTKKKIGTPKKRYREEIALYITQFVFFVKIVSKMKISIVSLLRAIID